jgi:hypothetical protein
VKKKIWIFILIPLMLILLYTGTYIPHKVVNIDPATVSKITVFDGSTGYSIDITDKNKINHIINNLNEITFQKGKSSFGYLGYRFNTSIFDDKGKEIKELIINSKDTIRYKGFFYTSEDQQIDFDFIEELVRENSNENNR